MRGLSIFLIGAYVVSSACGGTVFESGPDKVTLVELFTSEGCSSCPPAEAWVNHLTADARLWRKLVPVSFHVDYWDGLGWKDPLAKKQFTIRQQQYSEAWRISSVYTPGFAIDGEEWKGWFDGQSLPNADANKAGGNLRVATDREQVDVTFLPAEKGGNFNVSVAPLAMDVSSNVHGGENRGRKLTHSFAALELVTMPLVQTGERYSARVPIRHMDGRALAVWITAKGDFRPIQATGGYLP